MPLRMCRDAERCLESTMLGGLKFRRRPRRNGFMESLPFRIRTLVYNVGAPEFSTGFCYVLTKRLLHEHPPLLQERAGDDFILKEVLGSKSMQDPASAVAFQLDVVSPGSHPLTNELVIAAISQI